MYVGELILCLTAMSIYIFMQVISMHNHLSPGFSSGFQIYAPDHFIALSWF